jgi:Putative addiction module component
MNADRIEAEVLALPVERRASLARQLLLSLDELSEEEFDRIWGDESARRMELFNAGEVELIPSDVVAANARLRLR